LDVEARAALLGHSSCRLTLYTEMETSAPLLSGDPADAWLAPVFLDERAEAYPGVAPSAPDPQAVDDAGVATSEADPEAGEAARGQIYFVVLSSRLELKTSSDPRGTKGGNRGRSYHDVWKVEQKCVELVSQSDYFSAIRT
jgi:hypothetical protein